MNKRGEEIAIQNFHSLSAQSNQILFTSENSKRCLTIGIPSNLKRGRSCKKNNERYGSISDISSTLISRLSLGALLLIVQLDQIFTHLSYFCSFTLRKFKFQSNFASFSIRFLLNGKSKCSIKRCNLQNIFNEKRFRTSYHRHHFKKQERNPKFSFSSIDLTGMENTSVFVENNAVSFSRFQYKRETYLSTLRSAFRSWKRNTFQSGVY